MRPLPASPDLAEPGAGAALLAFARRLDSAGLERSMKFDRRGIDDGRFLLSFGASPAVARDVMKLAVALDAPASLSEALAAIIPEARFIHLGYEPRQDVIKIYAEGGPGDGRPLFTACKWNRTGQAAVDDYRPWKGDLAELVGQTFGAHGTMLADACLSLAQAQPPLFVLEVVRRGGGRRSFDLRLYDGGLTVSQSGLLVEAIARTFAVDARAALAARADETLGHLSGGCDADGSPFVTIYFGAKALT